MIWGASSCFRRSRAGRGRPQEVQNAPKGAPGEPQMGPRSAPGEAQEAARRPQEPPRGERRPKWSPKGLRMSPRRRQAFEKAPENSWEHRGGKENARRARAAREQGPHAKAAYNIAGSSANLGKQLQSISLTTAGTGKQLAPPASHRSDRNVACTTAKPPQGPENGLHHRLATGKPRTTARRTFARTASSDSAFRFLSSQVTESGHSARL